MEKLFMFRSCKTLEDLCRTAYQDIISTKDIDELEKEIYEILMSYNENGFFTRAYHFANELEIFVFKNIEEYHRIYVDYIKQFGRQKKKRDERKFYNEYITKKEKELGIKRLDGTFIVKQKSYVNGFMEREMAEYIAEKLKDKYEISLSHKDYTLNKELESSYALLTYRNGEPMIKEILYNDKLRAEKNINLKNYKHEEHTEFETTRKANPEYLKKAYRDVFPKLDKTLYETNKIVEISIMDREYKNNQEQMKFWKDIKDTIDQYMKE
jgi:hypothetical protein